MTAPVEVFGVPAAGTEENERRLRPALIRGLLGRCPACGEGRLFRAYLKPVDICAACGEALHHQRADDLPAYLVIFVVGHIMVGGWLMTELLFDLSSWSHLAIWVPISIAAALLILQPLKGAVIGLQWALRMHGFGGTDDAPEPLPDRE